MRILSPGSTIALLNTVGERFEVAGKQALLPLGIDVETPSSLHAATNAKTVLFVGRLEPRKGIDVLLAATPAGIQGFWQRSF